MVKKVARLSLNEGVCRKDLQNLSGLFPALTRKELRGTVGGYTVDEIKDYLCYYLGNQGYGFTDGNGNYHWYRYDYDSGYYYSGNSSSRWYQMYESFVYGSEYGYSSFGDGVIYTSGNGMCYAHGYENMMVAGDTTDVKGSCVFDSLATMMSLLRGEDMDEGKMRKKYCDYLVGLGEEEALRKALNPVQLTNMFGFMEYLGFDVTRYGQDELIKASLKGKDIHGLAIVGLVDPLNGQIDLHAIAITDVVRTANGEPLYFTYDDKQNLVAQRLPIGNRLLPEHISYYLQLQ